ncbi:MAG: hypothetical protein ACR2HM_05490 [Acidimicrobiales bacterium]
MAWALAGEPWGDDARMLELLEPWRGHQAGAGAAPHYGPRMPLRSIAAQ